MLGGQIGNIVLAEQNAAGTGGLQAGQQVEGGGFAVSTHHPTKQKTPTRAFYFYGGASLT